MNLIPILLLFRRSWYYVYCHGVSSFILELSGNWTIVQNIVKRNIKMNIEDLLFDANEPVAAEPGCCRAELPAPTDVGKKTRTSNGADFRWESILIQA
jgi:hypothetical protein